jgi:3'(2'), 5'-bisphosphate nucleotidase
MTTRSGSVAEQAAILSEESDTATFEQRSKWQEYWLVDPLDGTQDFLEQTGEFV